jgi:conjugal transfer pilin signal peptidase TrbI
MTTIPTTTTARLLVIMRSLRFCVIDLSRFLLRHWFLTLLAMLLYGSAWHLLYINLSHSLPYTVIWLERGQVPHRGELMVYRCCAHSDGITPSNLLLFKKVAGIEGDTVEVHGRAVYVNDRLIGLAKERTSTGQTLNPIISPSADGVELQQIPAGFYFAQGLTDDSFDSRYRQSGLVAQSAIVGVAHPLF